MKKRWTPEELEYLKNNWNLLSLTEIITALDRTEDSITRKARRLNIDTRKKTEDKLVKTWTDKEDQCLIQEEKQFKPNGKFEEDIKTALA